MTDKKIVGFPPALIVSIRADEYIDEIVHEGDPKTIEGYWEGIKEPEDFYEDEIGSIMVLYRAVEVKQIQPVKSRVITENWFTENEKK